NVTAVSWIVRSGFWLRPRAILSEISVSIPQGETLGIVGPNGAGKTSLVQLIAGIREPSRGTVVVAGSEARSREARKKMGFLPERSYLPDFLSGREYLRFCGALSGLG